MKIVVLNYVTNTQGVYQLFFENMYMYTHKAEYLAVAYSRYGSDIYELKLYTTIGTV